MSGGFQRSPGLDVWGKMEGLVTLVTVVTLAWESPEHPFTLTSRRLERAEGPNKRTIRRALHTEKNQKRDRARA